MRKESRSIEKFSKIEFKDFGTLILSQADQESLEIEADEELFPELTAEVRGDTLHLGINDDWFNRIGKVISSIFNGSNQKVTYTLNFVDLDKISISGKCDLACDYLAADSLELNVSGLGNLAFSQIDCHRLDVRISGRGEFSAAGRAEQQQIRISGSGDYQAPDLASQSIRIVISGQGNATLRVQESLDITISGLGQVNYYGHPKLRQVISGMGKSKRLNQE